MAILVPLAGYLIVDYYGKNVVPVPAYFIPERVDTITKNGQVTYDTVFHQIKDFEMTNQLGQKVSLKDMEGKVLLVDFFFTSCPSICPTLTKNLRKIQSAYVKNDSLLQILSFSVDPVRDSVDKLRKYAYDYQINPDNWWLLTGDKKEIYDLARHEFFVSVTEGDGGPDDFVHTEKLVLIDKNKNIRGYYDGLDSNAVVRCARDIATLHLAKDRHRPGFVQFLKKLFSGN
ncbi:SCO family protein [Chitinophaga nivalis]|uniref:SCO family protein n=1 Tax=Chitinophaga nivalis TaxID=2991709 RepID=A0ABT3IUQ2_9BACT|nr:SCO family protein [Chitinophaga nivalis]MCW3462654.1 SCO family protein [Chitinophaga nivalis]MCW3487655.1 SCO family protein [Chitinophaga nivalis]